MISLLISCQCSFSLSLSLTFQLQENNEPLPSYMQKSLKELGIGTFANIATVSPVLVCVCACVCSCDVVFRALLLVVSNLCQELVWSILK